MTNLREFRGSLVVYEPGDQLATISSEGRALIWRVKRNGLLVIHQGSADSFDPDDLPYDDADPYADDHD